jgi:thiol-disulfide isomerase/thioredoxin
MQNKIAYIFLFFFLATSCTQNKNYGDPIVEPAIILKSLMSFLVYREDYLRLSEDFTAFDPASHIISKETFLKLFSSGEYLPLRLISKDSSSYYRLNKLSDTTNEDIQQTIKSWGEHLYALYKMEGKELPGYNFVDLEGNTYNKETSKGKILVLKCWFIGCVPCVKEMPALNEVVKQYKNRRDILFVSLAFDSKEDLKKFLKNITFNYQIVPDQEKYIMEDLKITSFPTHLIINKKGLITKVVNDYKEMVSALNKEALK